MCEREGDTDATLLQLRAGDDSAAGELYRKYAGREVVESRLIGRDVGEIAAATPRSKRTVERLLQDTLARLHAALAARGS